MCIPGPVGIYRAGTGIAISGNVLDATNADPIWHASSILGRLISSVPLSNSMVLACDSSFYDWSPALTSGGGSLLWSQSGSNIFHNAGSVAVGTNTFEAGNNLSVSERLFVNTSSGGMNLGFPNNGSQWQMATVGGGDDLLFRSKPASSIHTPPA